MITMFERKEEECKMLRPHGTFAIGKYAQFFVRRRH